MPPARSASRAGLRTGVTRPRAPATPARTGLPPLQRARLDNGLRVLLAPDRSAPVAAVAVHYDVGFRSEPEGRTGFAHLFEHMMFQGSGNLGKTEHASLIQGAGGQFNGSTHPDYTDYYEVVPSAALELALFCEADRMRGLQLTEENLANQVAVVQNEIRVNVTNRPYGGFPWILLPPVVFATFANAHNGYGDFHELEAATVGDATSFFRDFYAPANAVLTVAGDFDPAQALDWVGRHFADVPARRPPDRPSFAEPAPAAERRVVHVDPLAPAPALALGWIAPDPFAAAEDFLAAVVAADTLAAGDASRLHQRLVVAEGLATTVEAYLGTFGNPFDQRDPLLLTVEVVHPREVEPARVLAALDTELARLADEGPSEHELHRVAARGRAQLLRQADFVLSRALSLGVAELLTGRAETVGELPDRLAAVSAEAVRSVAARLRPDNRGVLELRAGAGE